MGIKDTLDQPDGKFVSIDQAVSRLSTENGVSYVEAAHALHITLRDADSQDVPGWAMLDPDKGLLRIADGGAYISQVRLCEEYGEPEKWPEGTSTTVVKSIGFDRRSLANFLARNKISIGFSEEIIPAIGAALTAQPTDGLGPDDLPEELYLANVAFRAVMNGYGDKSATFKNRLIEYLKANYPYLKKEVVKRISTVANTDKAPGRKKSCME
jgi:hypothetical protein